MADSGAAARFAARVAGMVGVRFGVPVNRGRTAIELGLRALGIGAGSDVVVAAYVCQTAIDGIEAAGARAVLADVGPDLHITVDSVFAARTPRTRAVLVPHLFGGTAPVDDIVEHLNGTGIIVIDDAAQVFGARRAGRLVGAFGHFGIVGVGAGKSLAGPAGAVLVTDDPTIAAAASGVALPTESPRLVARRTARFVFWRHWRRLTLPMESVGARLGLLRDEPAHVSAGMAGSDAEIGLAQLARLESAAARRRTNGLAYLRALDSIADWNVTPLDENSAALKIALIVPPQAPSVEIIVQRLLEIGVEAQRGYASRARTSVERAAVRVAERLAPQVVCISLEVAPSVAVLRRLRGLASSLAPVSDTARRDGSAPTGSA